MQTAISTRRLRIRRLQASPTASRGGKFCSTSSIIRPITAARRMPAVRSSPGHARLTDLVRSYADGDLDEALAYQTTSGKPYSQPRREILLHLFNHQTHHRGQAHA